MQAWSPLGGGVKNITTNETLINPESRLMNIC